MASSLSRLRSTASTFHSLHIARPVLSSIAARLYSTGVPADGVLVKATPTDLAAKFGGETVVRLKSTYMDTIVPLLIQEFNYKNLHQVPKIEKVVVKCGTTGGATQTANGMKTAMAELTLITGQSPVKKKATKEIQSFKGNAKSTYKMKEQAVVTAVTLRGNVMYSFLDRLINRLMEFQEVKPRFDGKGSYSISFGEQCVFPEISTDLLGASRGMVVRVTTTATTDLETYKLLALMGLPCKDVPKKKDVSKKKA